MNQDKDGIILRKEGGEKEEEKRKFEFRKEKTNVNLEGRGKSHCK